jgi:protein regulator of cytokinesis 1
VDPCEVLSSIEVQIAKANEDSLTRKDIMERVDKWLSACDEETWLEEYNQVRFFSSLKDISRCID